MIQHGKIPPNAIEFEKAVIGALILESESFDLVSNILKAEHFYSENMGFIFQSFLNLSLKNSPIDLLTVSKELKEMGKLDMVGGYYEVSQLTNNIASAANIETYARIIVQKYVTREIIRIGTLMIQKGYQDDIDVFELIDWSGNEINNVLNVVDNKQIKTLYEVANEVISDCMDNLTKERQVNVPVPIKSFQAHTNGWKNGNLIILAARPGMGKTAGALEYGYEPAKQGIPIGFFSLEMTSKELAGRLLSKESYINSQKINNANLDSYELTAIKKDVVKFKNMPFYIDDTPSLNIVRLRSKAMRMVREFKIKLLIVDYLQLMDGVTKNGTRENEISTISRGLKKLAKELNIPVIALSQLSREVEKRPSKKPQLSDLRESGSIEQDADMVIFYLRPEYYGYDTYPYGNTEIAANGLLIKIIAKFRGGVTGEIKARWIGETTSIVDYDREIETPVIEVKEVKQIESNNNFLNEKSPF